MLVSIFNIALSLLHRKKYAEYSVNVDPAQDDKASEIKLCSFARPHMRAFHFSWWGFFTAFFIWYALAPLMVEIQKSLGLTKKQVWNSNIVGVSGTIFMRFLLGKSSYQRRECLCLKLILV